MAQDDFLIIVYKFLKRLYSDLKSGTQSDLAEIVSDKQMFPINDSYWAAILEDLTKKGYIQGASVQRLSKENVRIISGNDFRITMDGVEYLTENSTMRKIADVVGGIAGAVVSFIK